jgi:hypothetical protein
MANYKLIRGNYLSFAVSGKERQYRSVKKPSKASPLGVPTIRGHVFHFREVKYVLEQIRVCSSNPTPHRLAEELQQVTSGTEDFKQT